MKLTRRDFLLTASGILLTNSIQTKAQKGKRVIVLGAGLSGLAAAYELAGKGFEVTVIEARNRVGGRVFTLREPFLNGQYAEYGGELIGDGYKRFIGYLQKFDVPFEDVPEQFETSGSVATLQGGTGTTAILKNTLYPLGSVLSPHPYNLTGDEAKGLPPMILTRILRTIMRETANNPQKILELDKISLAEGLRARGVSQEAIRSRSNRRKELSRKFQEIDNYTLQQPAVFAPASYYFPNYYGCSRRRAIQAKIPDTKPVALMITAK